MNKKFFNGRRKKKKRKTRKKRGGNDEIIFEDMQGNDTFNKKSKYDIQVYMENNLLYKLIGKPVKKDNAFLYIELISYEQIYEPTFLLTLLSKTNESLALQLFETMLTEAIDVHDVDFGSLKIPIDENSYPLFNIKMNFSFIRYEPKGPMKSLEAPINLKCFKGRDLGFGRKKKTRKKRGGHKLKLHELKLNEVYIVSIHGKFMNKEMILEKIVKPYPERAPNFIKYYFKDASNENWTFNLHTLLDPYGYTIRKPLLDITANIKNLLNQGQGRRKKKTRRKRRKKRDEGGVAELIVGNVYLFTPFDAVDDSNRIEGTLINNTETDGVYIFLVGPFFKRNKPNTDIIAVNRDLASGRRKKKTRRKRRKKRDNAGCIPWRRRRRKKTKKIKTPSIDEIIKELSKSDSIDKEIAKELNLTLSGWR